tara:strand:+ start:3836 stop:3985 length:150 start_codon:yes stop_codon:yes gene_type:complete
MVEMAVQDRDGIQGVNTCESKGFVDSLPVRADGGKQTGNADAGKIAIGE